HPNTPSIRSVAAARIHHDPRRAAAARGAGPPGGGGGAPPRARAGPGAPASGSPRPPARRAARPPAPCGPPPPPPSPPTAPVALERGPGPLGHGAEHRIREPDAMEEQGVDESELPPRAQPADGRSGRLVRRRDLDDVARDLRSRANDRAGLRGGRGDDQLHL